ncbi:hypothetical protein BGS1_07625 [Clostridium beijerinckii]|nr:hypothetical protein BGS1_07625 [Clostridium beijerinckii]
MLDMIKSFNELTPELQSLAGGRKIVIANKLKDELIKVVGIEGVVRILTNPEEGENLKKGEILVASTTNVGWTPLFPKTSAIITDIGAPLSHAAIVARELGIPAVGFSLD